MVKAGEGRWGIVALVVAAIAVLLVEPGGWQIALAGLATVLLARDRRFGPMAAALVVVLALPYDRAANSDLLRLAGVPLRPQDAAIAIGIVLTLPSVRRPRLSAPLVAIALFSLVGIGALLGGLVADLPLRDIFRDARWWFLYLAGALALAAGVRRDQVLRGLLLGAAIFSMMVIAATLLPEFAGGLKQRALVFDSGTLRMQFGNTIFLIPALAAALWRFLAASSWRRGMLIWLLLTAGVLSLTRTFVIVLILTAVAVTVAVWWSQKRMQTRPLLVIGGIVLAATLSGMFFNVGNAMLEQAIDVALGQPAEAPNAGESVFDRFLFEGDRSDVGSIVEGRFATYQRAFTVLLASPVVGHGLGTLVVVNYVFGGDPFATPGWLPNVDNAYLTVGMKAGVVGIAVFAAMILVLPLTLVRDRRLRWLMPWLLPAWGGILVLTMTQSFAITGYSPYGLSLLIVLGELGYASRNTARARPQL